MTDIAKRIAHLSPAQRELLERLLHQENAAPQHVQITARGEDIDSLPLSFEQQRLWFIDQLAPGNPAYNTPVAVRLKGQLDVDALLRSFNEILRRHEALRTTFSARDGQPVQVIRPAFDLPLPVHDLTDVPESEREDRAYQFICEEARRPSDLMHGPLLRAHLLRVSLDNHILLLTIHHIVIDAWSATVLFRELAALYGTYRHGQSSPLPALPIQYADYALWQRQYLQGETLDALLSYWRRHLADLPILHLPADRARPFHVAHKGAMCSLFLPQEIKDALQAISKQEQATLFMTMLTAFKVLLVRYSGQEDIVVGSSVVGRNRKELENLIGFFVNILVLRTNLAGAPSFREALRRVREECLQAHAHQELPFERLVEELHPERDPTRTPLFQVFFQSVEGMEDGGEFPGLSLEPYEVTTETSKFDLLLNVREPAQGGMIVEMEYNTALFEAATIKRMLDHYQVLLEGIIAHPDQSIRILPLLTPDEQQTMLETWNQTQSAYPDDLCLHELFEARVRAHPQAVALIYEEQRLTYAQLNARANQLAHYLKRLGIGPEVVIGLCVEPSVEMIVGILGILKAGGAYAPLNPAYPKERLAFLLSESSTPIVLAQNRLVSRLPETGGQVICLDTDWTRIAQENDNDPVSSAGPENPAYIIYTSGSTGTPKGIVIRHRGIVNNLVDINRRFNVGPADKVLFLTSLSFDISVFEILGILAAGGATIIPSASASKDPASWAGLLREHQVTLWNSAPSLLELLIEHCENTDLEQKLHLRLAIVGGDWIPVTLLDRLKVFAPGVLLTSIGGATESSICSIIYTTETSDPSWKSIPYGYPMANQHAYILDASFQPVPIGVPGELLLGGIGLARGYLHRPDLTAEKFIPHPFGQKPGERLYKTGDLARYRADGTIELLGRIDFLVKIRGLRIELGEIEAILRQHPTVQDAVVLVKEDGAGDKQLAAYIVPQTKELEPAISELHPFLAARLPEYMQPKTFIVLDSLPLSANGKIDRKRLPEPEQLSRQVREAFVPPRDELEAQLARTWSEVLGIEQISIDDNFFDLGGDSFKAIRAARTCGHTLPLIDFFQNPTIRQLSAYLQQSPADSAHMLFELTPPATEARLSLVCVPYGGGDVVSYQPLAKSLPEGYKLYSVALPGHDFSRPDEHLPSRESVASACVEEIIHTVQNEPLALYGQCAGVALTVEMAQLLEQRGVQLKAVYLGAAFPNNKPVEALAVEKNTSDNDLLEWVRWLGGFEEALTPEETRHFLRAMRYDVINSTTFFQKAISAQPVKLKAPIFCVVGTEDALTEGYETRFQEWNYFGETVQLRIVQGGGHYFVKYDAGELARIIAGTE